MSRLTWRVALGLLIVLLGGVPGRAHAQSAPDVARARRLSDRGRELVQVGRFPEALVPLRRSMELSPNPGTAYNLAVALRGTGELIDARELFERIRGGELGAVGPAERRELRLLVRELERDIAQLTIRVTGGAVETLRLDGRPLRLEAGGVELRVNPGDHRLTLDDRAHEPVERTLHLDRGERRRVLIELEPRQGTLVVEAPRPSDRVVVVGVGEADGHLRRSLTPGTYTVRVRGADGAEQEREVDLAPGALVRLQLGPSDARPLRRNPWIWVAVGVVAAGVGVGLGLGLRDDSPGPVTDPYYGVIQTLGRFP